MIYLYNIYLICAQYIDCVWIWTGVMWFWYSSSAGHCTRRSRCWSQCFRGCLFLWSVSFLPVPPTVCTRKCKFYWNYTPAEYFLQPWYAYASWHPLFKEVRLLYHLSSLSWRFFCHSVLIKDGIDCLATDEWSDDRLFRTSCTESTVRVDFFSRLSFGLKRWAIGFFFGI